MQTPSCPYRFSVVIKHLRLLVDPVKLAVFVGLNLTLLEPESNFLLSIFDAVGTVADVTANINGIVTTDGARGRGERVGGTEDSAASLDGITAFPDHGGDGAAQHVGNKAGEERFLGKVGIVLLEVLTRRRDQLDSDKLEATLLETRDDGSDEAALDTIRLDSDEGLFGRHCGYVKFKNGL